MSEKFKLTKLYVAEEATFGVDPDADGSDFKFIPTLEDATWTPQQTVIPREAQVNKFTRQSHIMGAKSGVMNFKTYLKASGLAAAVTAAAAAESDSLLKSCMGEVVRGTSDAIQGSGSTTTVLNVADGTHFRAGMLIAVAVSGTLYLRFVVSIATNALTIDRALPSAPATSAVVYASSIYRPIDNGHVSLSIVGYRDGVEYTFSGCTAELKISGINGNGLAVCEWTVACADWTKTTKNSLPSTLLTGITAVRPPAIRGAPFAIGGTEEPVHSFEFDPGIKFQFQESTNGGGLAGGDGVVFGFEKTSGQPSGNVKAYYAASHFVDFVAGTERSLAVAAGTQLNGWGVYIPKAQYNQPAFEEHQGVIGEAMPFMVNDGNSATLAHDFYICVF